MMIHLALDLQLLRGFDRQQPHVILILLYITHHLSRHARLDHKLTSYSTSTF